MASQSSWPLLAAAALVLALPLPARAESPAGSVPLDDPTLIALAVALAVSPAPRVEEEVPAETPRPADEPRLELVATVRARSIVFEQVPQVNVTFTGSGPRRTTWSTERFNLPARVEPGVVYRDVAVRLTIRSTMEDLAVLLRDAKSASLGLRVEPEAAPTAVPASLGAAATPPPAVEPAAPSAPTAIAPAPAPR